MNDCIWHLFIISHCNDFPHGFNGHLHRTLDSDVCGNTCPDNKRVSVLLSYCHTQWWLPLSKGELSTDTGFCIFKFILLYNAAKRIKDTGMLIGNYSTQLFVYGYRDFPFWGLVESPIAKQNTKIVSNVWLFILNVSYVRYFFRLCNLIMIRVCSPRLWLLIVPVGAIIHTVHSYLTSFQIRFALHHFSIYR